MRIDDRVPRVRPSSGPSGPDVRPLGFMAVGFALVSLILAPTYFLSLLAYLTALPAVVLGVAARGLPATRSLGNTALLLAGAAVVCATGVVLLWY